MTIENRLPENRVDFFVFLTVPQKTCYGSITTYSQGLHEIWGRVLNEIIFL